MEYARGSLSQRSDTDGLVSNERLLFASRLLHNGKVHDCGGARVTHLRMESRANAHGSEQIRPMCAIDCDNYLKWLHRWCLTCA